MNLSPKERVSKPFGKRNPIRGFRLVTGRMGGESEWSNAKNDHPTAIDEDTYYAFGYFVYVVKYVSH